MATPELRPPEETVCPFRVHMAGSVLAHKKLTETRVEMFPSRVHIFSKHILCYFSYLIGPDVHLVRVQTNHCKRNRTVAITLHSLTFFSSYFIKYLPYQVIEIDYHKIYILCFVISSCTVGHFYKTNLPVVLYGCEP